MLIHLEKLGKTFGEKVVLHDVTASVEREDRIGIVGQNGAGKTTLLKILTGEYQDYAGLSGAERKAGRHAGYLRRDARHFCPGAGCHGADADLGAPHGCPAR